MNLLLNPLFSNSIIFIILFIVLFMLYKLNLLTEKFIHFGPGTNNENTIHFLNIKIDNWYKTIGLYCYSLIVSIMLKYYNVSSLTYINQYIKNPKVSVLPFNKIINIIIIYFSAILSILLPVLNTLVYITPQLQFIIPNLLAAFIITIPGNLYYLNIKDNTQSVSDKKKSTNK